jgi:hypothetical protein
VLSSATDVVTVSAGGAVDGGSPVDSPVAGADGGVSAEAAVDGAVAPEVEGEAEAGADVATGEAVEGLSLVLVAIRMPTRTNPTSAATTRRTTTATITSRRLDGPCGCAVLSWD